MPLKSTSLKVAAVQTSPVFLDRDATVEKACALTAEAAQHGARLVTFPEAFVPAYPDWAWAVPPGRRRMLNDLYAELVANAVDVPGTATAALCDAARAAGTAVVIGVNERNAEASGASLYNTLLFINEGGILLGKRRKLIPTAAERTVWAAGDGSTLGVFPLAGAKVAGLICWENYMPLARYAMVAQGAQVLVAATWDRGEPWLSSMRHVAREGGVFVVSVGMALRVSDIPDRYEFKSLYPVGREWINAGDSCVVDPEGAVIAGPLHEKQEILYADLDLSRVAAGRRMLDVAGHYAARRVHSHDSPRIPAPTEMGGFTTEGTEGTEKPPRTNATEADETNQEEMNVKPTRGEDVAVCLGGRVADSIFDEGDGGDSSGDSRIQAGRHGS